MRPSELLLLGVIGVAAFALARRASALGTLIFMPGRVVSISLEGTSPVMTLELVVQNTSSQSLVVNSLAGNLFANNYLVGNVSSFVSTRIPGNAQAVIPVKVRLMLIGLVNDIVQSFQNGNFTQDVRLEGFANAGFVRAPLDITFRVGSPVNAAGG